MKVSGCIFHCFHRESGTGMDPDGSIDADGVLACHGGFADSESVWHRGRSLQIWSQGGKGEKLMVEWAAVEVVEWVKSLTLVEALGQVVVSMVGLEVALGIGGGEVEWHWGWVWSWRIWSQGWCRRMCTLCICRGGSGGGGVVSGTGEDLGRVADGGNTVIFLFMMVSTIQGRIPNQPEARGYTVKGGPIPQQAHLKKRKFSSDRGVHVKPVEVSHIWPRIALKNATRTSQLTVAKRKLKHTNKYKYQNRWRIIFNTTIYDFLESLVAIIFNLQMHHCLWPCVELASGQLSLVLLWPFSQAVNEYGRIRRGKVTIFRSGDDLEDDFTMEVDGKKDETGVTLGCEAETDIDVRPKKNRVTRVVNFLG
ncbi:hypothetical protein ACLOJK_024389 [Asimina triloba]